MKLLRKRSKLAKTVAVVTTFVMLLTLMTGCGESSDTASSETASSETTSSGAGEISADDAIVSLTSLASIESDGAKVYAVAVEYSVDLTGAEVKAEDYTVGSYVTSNPDKVEVGDAEAAGLPVNAYVNDAPETTDSPSGTGNYVIIELNTDYQLSSSTTYDVMVSADVLQTGTLEAQSSTITPGTEAFANYTSEESVSMMGTVSIKNYVNEGAYSITGAEMFTIHPVDGEGEYAPFEATNCFDEATGEYSDVTVPYSIYVPEDYDASGSYALVLVIGSAGNASNDCWTTLTTATTATDLASEEVQQYAIDNGVDGLIVVCPQVPEDLRSTRDNWTVSAAVSAHWQFLDYITETYSIDMDHIYGTGQSMGGMQILEMAAQRDNYFAGIWAVGCQWGNNYNKEAEYDEETYYASPADGTIIWTVDADGNECDYQNWYYMISDDNILITNCVDDAFSSGTWQELAYLYEDTCGVTFPKATVDPLNTSIEDQNAALDDLLAQDSDNGFYWFAFTGGSHTGTWVYAYQLSSGYEWLLSQTRETEQEREKLDLDKPFVEADEQIQTEERIYGTDTEENTVYYVTAAEGCGTADYNSPVFVHSGTIYRWPNWKVED